MHWGLMKAIVVLPGTVVVLIPGAIFWATQDSELAPQLASPDETWFWLALLAAIVGLVLGIRTATLFLRLGGGTPAPWEPPRKLVIHGPYRYVRNPMITGVLCLLFAEALLLRSGPIALWMIIFFIGNAIYFPLVEERGLEKRFGNEYWTYKAHVPRWVPRLKPWAPVSEDKQNNA